VDALRKRVKQHPGVTALLGCLIIAVVAVGFFAYPCAGSSRWLPWLGGKK
jgi:hypothetical protein